MHEGAVLHFFVCGFFVSRGELEGEGPQGQGE